MAGFSEKELRALERRISNIAGHLLPVVSASLATRISPSPAAANDSYHRVHGEVNSKEAVWSIACDDSGKEFMDIIYEKSVGEGIAKVNFT